MRSDSSKWSAGKVAAVFILAAATEVATMATFGLAATHHEVLGVTGAAAVLLAVTAAIVAGPVVGCLTAIVAGVAFFGFVSDYGATAPAAATLASTAAWGLSALAAGLVANRLRRQQTARRAAEEDAARLHGRLEASLLPHVDHETHGLQISTRYRPSERRLGIGGDFYGVAALPSGEVAVALGDVVGHGPDAAALGATLRASWHALSLSGADPARLVSTLNAVFQREQPSPDAFATLCLAWFHTPADGARFLLLGHPPPLLIDEGRVTPLPIGPSPPLGLVESSDCVPTEVGLPKGWALLFFTDGLIEGQAAPGATKRYGLERLLATVAREAQQGLDEAGVDRVIGDVAAANGGPLHDDMAVLWVTRAADRATIAAP